MKDFLGHELFIGDECVCMRRKKGDTGTFYWVLQKGIIIALDDRGVIFRDADYPSITFVNDPLNTVKVEFEV